MTAGEARGPRGAPPAAAAREGWLAGLLAAALLAAAAGAMLGAIEALGVLLSGAARATRDAARLPLAAAATYALLGAGLALPGLLLARLLHGRPQHRAAPPSACAALGSAAALAALAFAPAFPVVGLPPAALAGTLLCLALKELLGWWPAVRSPRTYAALAGALLAAGAFASERLPHSGSPSWWALPAALACAFAACAAVLGPPRRGPAAAAALALAAAALAGQSGAGYPLAEKYGSAGRPNVLHVSIDTLRADHVGCYGHASAHTPTIDRLAAEGVLFEGAIAQANTTGPSHTTQLTGRYPVEHGAISNGRPIAEGVPALPDLLSAAEGGWNTAAFVSGFTLADEACGLAARFEHYDDNLLAWQWLPQAALEIDAIERVAFRFAGRFGPRVARSDRPAGETVDAALDWLAARPAGAAPFYLFLHLYDPHAPYRPPPEHAPRPARLDEFDWYALDSAERERLVADGALREHMLALYDGEIAYADAELGRFLGALAERGELDRTLVILTSDHGEGLGAHGYYYDHGSFLYDEELHVPLILRLPGKARAGTRVEGLARLIDLAPTVLELCGVPAPADLSGTSLVPLLGGAAPADGERAAFAHSEMAGEVSSFALLGRRLALRTERFKLIWTSPHWRDTERVPERYELYDLARDPGEQADIWPSAPGQAAALEEQLARWRDAMQSVAETGALDEDVREHLRALGYL